MALIHLTHPNILYMYVIWATAWTSAFHFKGTMEIEISLNPIISVIFFQPGPIYFITDFHLKASQQI